MTARRRIAVIGGGIAGMAAAYELATILQAEGEIMLLEASSRLGGKIETERRAGLTMELGPDAFLSTKPWAIELCRQIGLDDLVGTNPRQRDVFILHRGRLEPLPDGLTMMVPTRIAPLATTRLLSLPGKLRASLEPLLPAANGQPEESLEAFITRRFGHELYQSVVEPMMSGIYAGDGSQLSLEATFPILAEWERRYGSVARGALALRRRRKVGASQGASSLFLAPAGGLERLVDRLAAQLVALGVSLVTEWPVRQIEKTAGGYLLRGQDDQTIKIDGMVVAAPSFDAAKLLANVAPALAALLSRIEYASTATVNLAFDDPELAARLDGYGYVVPSQEGRPALACSWSSTKFPQRAPAGTALLRVFMGRHGRDEIVDRPDIDLIKAARHELAASLGITRPPDVVRVKRWHRAMPQYNLGHLERIGRIEAEAAAFPGIELAGAAYHGIGIPDCIHSGRQAAERLTSQLG